MRKFNPAAAKAIRVAVGLGLRDCAGKAEINPGYLSRVERGEREPSPRVAKSIARALGVSLDAITYLAEDAA